MDKFYYYLLGLKEPWRVTEVKLDINKQQVDVWVDYNASSSLCPECQAQCPIYDHVSERSWRHLDSCGFKTYIHAKIPRTNCKQHGVLQINVPWALGAFTLHLNVSSAGHKSFTAMHSCWSCKNIADFLGSGMAYYAASCR